MPGIVVNLLSAVRMAGGGMTVLLGAKSGINSMTLAHDTMWTTQLHVHFCARHAPAAQW